MSPFLYILRNSEDSLKNCFSFSHAKSNINLDPNFLGLTTRQQGFSISIIMSKVTADSVQSASYKIRILNFKGYFIQSLNFELRIFRIFSRLRLEDSHPIRIVWFINAEVFNLIKILEGQKDPFI